MKKRVVNRYLVLILIFLGLVFALLILKNADLAGFAVFQQTQQSDFDLGTYSNTEYSSSAVRLSSGQVLGNYTSKIFDAGNDATWNFLSYSGTESNIEFILAVDNQADVWKSVNQSVTWSLVKDDYNAGDGNAVTASFFNSTKTYFIIDNQDVWKSENLGVTWSKINDDYNGAEGQNSFVAIADKNNYLYIIEGDQDVWKSSDSGVSWTKVSTDFNGGNGNVFGLIVNSSNILIGVDNQADVWYSASEGVSWSLLKDDYNGATGNNADGMVIDSNNNLYILDLQDVHKSTDSGVTWSKVNDDFNGAGDSENGKSIITDSNNYVYIIDGGEDVFKSTDSGVSFTKVATNFNGANGITPTMATVIKTTNLTIQVRNCSLLDCSDASFVDVSLASLNLIGRYFQYKVLFESPDSSITPTLTNITIDYDLINSAPTMNLVSPGEGNTYGYNTSLSLNFSVSDADNNIQSCWYNLDNNQNITISNCLNITFDVAEGSHSINIYANDTQGLETSDSSSFTVNVGAPTITLSSPVNAYLTSQQVTFRYIPEDVDLQSCELWGFSSLDFNKNQTDSNPSSGVENTFSLTLPDGNYLWNVKCNDTQGHAAFEGNKTFTIDTTNPSLSLTQPTGTKSSRTVTASWTVSDANIDSCKYNVYRGANLEVTNTSVTCSSNTTSFDVTVDADFVLNFYTTDLAGNSNSSSLSFSVSTSTNGGGDTGGTSSEGGGGGSSVGNIIPPSRGGRMKLSGLGDVVANPGDSKTLSVTVKSTSATFLNKCKLEGKGDYASLISNNEVKGLSTGQQEDFVFVLNIPEDFSGEAKVEIEVACVEGEESASFNVFASQDIMELDLLSTEQKNKNFNFVYSIKEKKNKGQDINAEYWLEDSDGNKFSEFGESFSLGAGEETVRTVSLDMPDVAGEYILNVQLTTDGSIVSLEEPILIGTSTGFLGGAILVAGGGRIVAISVAVVVLAFAVIYIVRKYLKRKKVEKLRGGFERVSVSKNK